MNIRLKSDKSFIQASGIINNIEGDYEQDELYHYEIKIEDS